MKEIEESIRVHHLKESVEKELPMMRDLVATDAKFVVLHQDAFAADYQPEEYILLGKAIKYIGLTGKEIRIIGNNRETLK